MADRIQLKVPGSERVLHVLSVKPEAVGQTDYWVFSSGFEEIAVPATSVKGRLDRLNIPDVKVLIGQTVKFARSVKTNQGGKPFWEMEIVSNGSGAEASSQSAGGEMGKPNAGTPSAAPSADSATVRKPTIREAYKQLTGWVMDEILPMYCEDELTMTAADVAAITATLFIQACQSGKVE